MEIFSLSLLHLPYIFWEVLQVHIQKNNLKGKKGEKCQIKKIIWHLQLLHKSHCNLILIENYLSTSICSAVIYCKLQCNMVTNFLYIIGVQNTSKNCVVVCLCDRFSDFLSSLKCKSDFKYFLQQKFHFW